MKKLRYVSIFCVSMFLCCLFIIASSSRVLAASPTVTEGFGITINGEALEFTHQPFLENSYVMVHIRPVAYFLGVDIYWHSILGVAVISSEGITITVEPDSNEIHWLCAYTGQSRIFEMPVPAQIQNSRLFAPAGYIITALDYTVGGVADFLITINGRRFLTPQEMTRFFEYGQRYEEGRRGVTINFERAAYWYRYAAEAGHPEAENNLGVFYRYGRGVPQNDATALYWFKRAAAQGQVLAEFNVGIMYFLGDGTKADYFQAAYWNARAAAQGLGHAQELMGFMYLHGTGAEQDYERAVYWLRLSAAQGHRIAQHNLGYVYSEGLGVAQNYETAIYWMRKAAAQGNRSSQTALGRAYTYGRGVAQNDAWAEFWFTLADGNTPTRITEQPEITAYGRQAAEEFLLRLPAMADFMLFDLTGNGIPEIFIQRGNRWYLYVYYNNRYRDWGLLFNEPRFYYEMGEILSMTIGNPRGFYELMYSHLELECDSGRVTPRNHRFHTTQAAIEHHFTDAFAANPTRYNSNIPLIPILPLTDLRYEIIYIW
jgi:TPR repeat protein